MDVTTIISDIHLGSEVSQAKALHHFLNHIYERSNRLILNGDVFDSMDFRRLKKHHWRVLSTLRKISDKMEVIWVCGNHDGPAEIISHLLGLTAVDEYEFTSGNKQVLVFHGHIFDEFLEEHPILTWIGDCIYAFLQWLDKTHYIARLAKHNSKHYLHCAENIKQKAVKLAKKRSCDIVCNGHTHHALKCIEDGVEYLNCGCWTELPCTYVTIVDGESELHEYDETQQESHRTREAVTCGC